MTAAFRKTLPIDLLTHIPAICGRAGDEWFDQLPEIIAHLETSWGVRLQKPFPGIEYNFVAPAIGDDGGRSVVKISPPYERVEIFREAKYLETRKGVGAIELLAIDRESKSILIEHALPGAVLFEYFKDDPRGCLGPAVATLRKTLLKPPTDMTDVGTLDEWFTNFERFKKTAFDQGSGEKAFAIYERYRGEAKHMYYLHGDFHPGNVVTATREPFLIIDAKGVVGHIGYDLGVFLNNIHWWQRDKPGRRDLLRAAIATFADAFEMEEREVREWAFTCMVIGAWWNFDDMPELYQTEVAITDIWDV